MCLWEEFMVLNDFDKEVTHTSWDPDGENKSLWIVSAGLGYTIPDTGKTVLLIVHQTIFNPTLSHNLLSTMQMRLHDVVLNEVPKSQCLKPTDLSHSISVRGDDVEDVLVIPLEFHGVVSFFKRSIHLKSNFKPVAGMNSFLRPRSIIPPPGILMIKNLA
jgi:hypothetical protein